MLQDMLTNLVVKKLIHEEHPTIDTGRCINKRQRKVVCTVCAQTCPHNVLEQGERPDWLACENCNICAASCPTRCILPSSMVLEQHCAMVQHRDTQLVVACDGAQGKADFSVPCLASLPWELVATLAIEKELVLVHHGCADCTQPEAQLQQMLQRVQQFLGEAQFKKRVLLQGAEAVLPEKAYSRRELFTLFSGKTKATASSVTALLTKKDEKLNGLFYRKLLHRYMKKAAESGAQAGYTIQLPAFTQDCWACGNCAKVCPQSAITFTQEEGAQTTDIVLAPWKCNACGLCERVCTFGGIAGMQPAGVDCLAPRTVREVRPPRCAQCGAPVQPGTPLCAVCTARAKKAARLRG